MGTTGRALPTALIWSPVDESTPYFPPGHHYPGDAGYDLACSKTTYLEPGKFTVVPTNVRVAFPDNVWCMLTGRSSTFKRGLITIQAIIDHGYRGPLFATVFNTTNQGIKIEPGERLIQMVMFNLVVRDLLFMEAPDFNELLANPEGERGSAGFGSTGKSQELVGRDNSGLRYPIKTGTNSER